jgi:acetoin utilization deacetylase AcuC-like enzyme
MSLVLFSTERFAEHLTPPGHPESPERADVMDVVAASWRQRGGEVVTPRPATARELARVHDADYLRQIAETAGSAVAFDEDTYTSPETYEIALLAAGASVDAVNQILDGRHERALALVRPPGHHAGRRQAMGFCFYNNVAVAAAHARARGIERVAIVDYDVHHGNGTQDIFEDEPSVLYVSLHQSPYYPGTGAAREVGRGAGTGFTVNVPLEAGAVDEDYRLVFAEVVLPVLRRFEPEIVLVSAGFDAHERDPLAGMRLSSQAFAAMTADLQSVADECCGGRLMLVTEGGYDLRALAESLLGVVNVLGEDATPRSDWPSATGVAPARGRAAIAAVKMHHRNKWGI